MVVKKGGGIMKKYSFIFYLSNKETITMLDVEGNTESEAFESILGSDGLGFFSVIDEFGHHYKINKQYVIKVEVEDMESIKKRTENFTF